MKKIIAIIFGIIEFLYVAANLFIIAAIAIMFLASIEIKERLW